MTTSPANKKNDIQKLQRAIVDGLEDVKAQDIRVFDTEELSALFERVIVASGASNRQTKALAASVRDAVREAGFSKPRIEGEGNGEWIIVDCGQAVVHIMQPSFRQYYNLEELWGDKPVRLKLGVAKPAAPAKTVLEVVKPSKVPSTLRRSNAAKIGVAEAFPSKAQVRKNEEAVAKAAKKSAVGKSPARKTASTAVATAKPAAKTPVRTVGKVIVPASSTRAKPAAKKAVAKKAATKRPAAKPLRKG